MKSRDLRLSYYKISLSVGSKLGKSFFSLLVKSLISFFLLVHNLGLNFGSLRETDHSEYPFLESWYLGKDVLLKWDQLDDLRG